MAASGDVAPLDSEPPLTHPEEMRATFSLKVGNTVSMQATARMTPAGIVAIGLMVGATAIAALALLRARR